MTNTELLESKIKSSGKKIGYLAEKCGMSHQHFRRCCNNEAEFRASQIESLCVELGISNLKERQAIFFAKSGL
ncbi:MAG: toxin-antitoxin system, antitoxin component, Xre family protein [Clostridia bacterium]|nr:toxin-antitoxin system, antitoxin component, Xre family protein [Clostridia bacterium]